MITSLTSHFTNANDMASTSHKTQKTMSTMKLKLRPVMKLKKDEVTKQGKGEWSRCVRWEKTDIITGKNEDTPTGLTGELHQQIYHAWWVCGTDVRQEGTQLMERNVGGEVKVER